MNINLQTSFNSSLKKDMDTTSKFHGVTSEDKIWNSMFSFPIVANIQRNLICESVINFICPLSKMSCTRFNAKHDGIINVIFSNFVSFINNCKFLPHCR